MEKDKSARHIEESSDFYNLSSLSPETGGYGEKVGMIDDEKQMLTLAMILSE